MDSESRFYSGEALKHDKGITTHCLFVGKVIVGLPRIYDQNLIFF